MSTIPPPSTRWLTAWLGHAPGTQFARELDGFEALDDAAAQAVRQALEGEPLARRLVYLPPQGLLLPPRLRWTEMLTGLRSHDPLWKLSPGWLLALTPSRLVLLRTVGEGAALLAAAIPCEAILSLQTGNILLYAWLAVHWAEHGAHQQVTLYYNAVSERVITPFLSHLYGIVTGCNERPDEDRLAGASDPSLPGLLADMPLKFQNLLPRCGLLPGERMQQSLYRPAIWQSRLCCVRRMVSPRLALITTGSSLLVFEEERGQAEGAYGLIATYLPADNIRCVQIKRGTQQLTLAVQLESVGAGQEYLIPFPLDMEERLNDFARSLRTVSMKGGSVTA